MSVLLICIFVYLFGCAGSYLQHMRPLIFVAVCGIFRWGMWDLVPWPWMEPGPPAMGVQNFSHRTTREVPDFFFFLPSTPLLGFTWKYIFTEVCSLPFSLPSSFPSHDSGSLQFWEPVEFHIGLPFLSCLSRAWLVTSDVSCPACWAKLFPFPSAQQAHRTHHPQSPPHLQGTNTHTGGLQPHFESLCEEIFPAGPELSRCSRASLTSCLSKARYIISTYWPKFLY